MSLPKGLSLLACTPRTKPPTARRGKTRSSQRFLDPVVALINTWLKVRLSTGRWSTATTFKMLFITADFHWEHCGSLSCWLQITISIKWNLMKKTIELIAPSHWWWHGGINRRYRASGRLNWLKWWREKYFILNIRTRVPKASSIGDYTCWTVKGSNGWTKIYDSGSNVKVTGGLFPDLVKTGNVWCTKIVDFKSTKGFRHVTKPTGMNYTEDATSVHKRRVS